MLQLPKKCIKHHVKRQSPLRFDCVFDCQRISSVPSPPKNPTSTGSKESKIQDRMFTYHHMYQCIALHYMYHCMYHCTYPLSLNNTVSKVLSCDWDKHAEYVLRKTQNFTVSRLCMPLNILGRKKLEVYYPSKHSRGH